MSRVLPLREFEPQQFELAELSLVDADLLWRNFGKVVKVQFPSPRTNDKWELTAQGWCGYLPLSTSTAIELQPKVEVESVWRMLDYAFFTEIKLFDDEFQCKTLKELIERLAAELARRVLRRARKGLYKTYVGESGRISCVRGRIQTTQTMRAHWIPEPFCSFQTHTSDIDDNRILTWTLDRITRSGLCSEPSRKHMSGASPLVRQAYRTMLGATSLTPYTGQDCRKRSYNRLNSDYAVLHALCRFFLDFLSPGLSPTNSGEASMLPFLIPMDRLFEDFVALWLHRHLEGWKITRQEKFDFGQNNQHFNIDIVLYHLNGKARCIIDTKYKAPKTGHASAADVAQVIAYAVAKRCSEAVLLYPAEIDKPLDVRINGIRVRTLTFPLDKKPEAAGKYFLDRLGLSSLNQTTPEQTEMDLAA